MSEYTDRYYDNLLKSKENYRYRSTGDNDEGIIGYRPPAPSSKFDTKEKFEILHDMLHATIKDPGLVEWALFHFVKNTYDIDLHWGYISRYPKLGRIRKGAKYFSIRVKTKDKNLENRFTILFSLVLMSGRRDIEIIRHTAIRTKKPYAHKTRKCLNRKNTNIAFEGFIRSFVVKYSGGWDKNLNQVKPKRLYKELLSMARGRRMQEIAFSSGVSVSRVRQTRYKFFRQIRGSLKSKDIKLNENFINEL